MRTKALVGAGLLALALSLSACGGGGSTGSSGTGSTSMPESSMSAAGGSPSSMASESSMAMAKHQGDFAGLNGKSVKGTVTVADGKVTLSGFSSDEGPDLHLYLASGTDEAAIGTGTQLGKVSFNTASQTFTLPAGAGSSAYVVVHCDKAKAVFGAAKLS
ncbi:DM13 domain-containing protein [Arthrobacter woluwensis]|uniref:DM13 domain-containing protein n=1 Tax=Arthrobacter woluwensis TaxID=156980 RepID=UPI001AF8223D|nr:DM13 domain-containing protein [Arthrobacter woluwensis]QTF71664.1 DM13 domain-containing protein [Arthrobacter woluwensis]